ncbi:MAG: LysM peptidoglycan-binding domain-containing protein [Caldilineaceae bacterium]|nr:LysM peptidoglycan-binding domain-containing protein [Caldilineaceae bacterium]
MSTVSSNLSLLRDESLPAGPVLPLPATDPQWTRRGFLQIGLVLVLLLSFLSVGPVAHAEDDVHVVHAGDSLAAIAKAYSVSVNDLAQNNGIANPNIIHVGQRLVIPGSAAATERAAADPGALPGGSGYFTVKRGDTLAQIAKDYGMGLSDVLRLNGLTNANLIWVGQQLRVSARVDAIQPEKQDKPAVASTIYIVQAEDTLEQIALDHKISLQELMVANGLPNSGFVWAGQKLRLMEPSTTEALVRSAPADGTRWIEINLSDQTLTAWQGDVPVLYTAVSTGTYRTPTVTGRYAINTKYSSQRMTGPGYDLPGVPWVMYFYSGYAIHGAYWHNNFGTPMSHGCVNMRPGEAEMLYSWADYGTEVYVHY